jgi:transposase
VDEAGKIVCEVKVASHPEDVVAVLKDAAWRIERIGPQGDRCRMGY